MIPESKAKLRLKEWSCRIAHLFVFFLAFKTALVWGLLCTTGPNTPNEGVGLMMLRGLICLLLYAPAMIILNGNADNYEYKLRIIKFMEQEKKENGPMLFNVQDSRLW